MDRGGFEAVKDVFVQFNYEAVLRRFLQTAKSLCKLMYVISQISQTYNLAFFILVHSCGTPPDTTHILSLLLPHSLELPLDDDLGQVHRQLPVLNGCLHNTRSRTMQVGGGGDQDGGSDQRKEVVWVSTCSFCDDTID